ncbi:hypothetical protein GOP47_0009188 [Adiantum capillus-veneris]|uniref:F-box domain-containing protein n=1 Tax=Adiantum capillus-veneris TaxID=13818 RepID=A0A9D4ZIG1_ADICA|nr:hypothetical protein GOP47_0009188 [Adiantum capillus-veneris]
MEGSKRASADKRLSVACGEINLLPVELIGTILSYVSSARHVARASATCRKWREAVKCHLHRLNFDDSDFKFRRNSTDSDDDSSPLDDCRDVIITEAVMQAEHLHDLSISCAAYGAKLNAAVVVALLRHTKHSLKSLTLLTPVRPSCNVLEKLARNRSTIESLVWGSAYLSGLTPRIHGISSLVSLTLNKLSSGFLKYEDFLLLFSMFPKLEHLFLLNFRLESQGASTIVIQTSVKTLSMEKLSMGFTNLVVRGKNLESLSLVGMRLSALTLWGETAGDVHIQNLSIRSSSLEKLVLPGSLQSLLFWNTNILQLFEACSLGSLSKVKLVKMEGLSAAWPAYSQIISMPSRKVNELHIFGGSPGTGIVDQLLAFKEMVALELHTVMRHTDHAAFTQWIVKFLSCCPSLKRLVIVLEGPRTSYDDGHQFVGRREYEGMYDEILNIVENVV